MGIASLSIKNREEGIKMNQSGSDSLLAVATKTLFQKIEDALRFAEDTSEVARISHFIDQRWACTVAMADAYTRRSRIRDMGKRLLKIARIADAAEYANAAEQSAVSFSRWIDRWRTMAELSSLILACEPAEETAAEKVEVLKLTNPPVQLENIRLILELLSAQISVSVAEAAKLTGTNEKVSWDVLKRLTQIDILVQSGGAARFRLTRHGRAVAQLLGKKIR